MASAVRQTHPPPQTNAILAPPPTPAPAPAPAQRGSLLCARRSDCLALMGMVGAERWPLVALAAAGAMLAALSALLPALPSRRRQAPPAAPAAAPAVPLDIDTGADDDGGPRRLRKAETVLQRRSSRLIVVLESSYDQHNQAAVLRTADSLGLQHVWLVAPVEAKGQRLAELQQAQKRKDKTTKKARAKAEKRAQLDRTAREQLQAASAGQGSVGGGDGQGGTEQQALSRKIARQSAEWLTLRHFPDSASCIEALRAEGCTIWVTVLSQGAVCLDNPALAAPSDGKLAVVFGREADGVSDAMVAAADELVYFPMHGFSASLNLSVSAALILQGILQKEPELRGAMDEEERCELRREWFLRLAKNEKQALSFPKWAAGPRYPRPFDDLRRTEEMRKAALMIPPKIQRRLAAAERKMERG